MLRDQSFLGVQETQTRGSAHRSVASFSQGLSGFAAVADTSQRVSGLGTKGLLLDLVQVRCSPGWLSSRRSRLLPSDYLCRLNIRRPECLWKGKRVDSPAGCSGQARQWLSRSWGPRLTAGRPCAEEERKRLGWHQADPGGLGFTSSGPGSPTSGPPHLQADCVLYV